MIRNDVARDERLSYRASGVLADLLSRPDNWRTSAERLAAARPSGEGRDAIRRALAELEQAGYLVRRKVRGAQGRYTWEQIVYDTPQPEVSAGQTGDGKPAAGNQSMAGPAGRSVSAGQTMRGLPAAGFPSSQEDLEEDHEDLEEDDLSGPAARSARVGDTEEDPDGDKITTSGIDAWRTQDRELFRSHVGDELISHGHPWKGGVFTADAFYTAFRTREKPIKWPGRFVESLRDVDDWLLDQGLERAT